MQDEKLVIAAKGGDKKAFEMLIDKYHNDLYYAALAIIRSGWDAMDICQDTFMKAFTSIHLLKDASSFKSWINKILVNKSLDYFRKNKKTISVSEIETNVFYEESNEEAMELMQAINKLKFDSRTILTLRYLEDMTIKDIAKVIGCPEGTVKSRLNTALKEIRVIMGANAQKEGKNEVHTSTAND